MLIAEKLAFLSGLFHSADQFRSLEHFIISQVPATVKVGRAVDHGDQAAPVKNATGEDSAEVARRMMVARAAEWLEAAEVRGSERGGQARVSFGCKSGGLCGG